MGMERASEICGSLSHGSCSRVEGHFRQFRTRLHCEMDSALLSASAAAVLHMRYDDEQPCKPQLVGITSDCDTLAKVEDKVRRSRQGDEQGEVMHTFSCSSTECGDETCAWHAVDDVLSDDGDEQHWSWGEELSLHLVSSEVDRTRRGRLHCCLWQDN
eukprot:TRINITY_DN2346_c0_g1_i2.p1 TRINITY_DN2346_c0_g1~~TRINITY_DN2346_c0_g1_i2.p1  ORF type:complete len:158 (-),score=20.93 TRINITY_DN2346_c0_g1_i2:206-679(-)